MAITHRDAGARLILSLGLLSGWLPAQAQTQTPAPMQPPMRTPAQAQEPVSPEGEPPAVPPTTQIQPTLDVFVTVTSNANGFNSNAPARHDTVLQTSAGLALNAKGANSHAEGKWKLTAIQFARNTQPDRVLPSGWLDWHSDLYRKELGIDANLSSVQRADPGLRPTSYGTADTTTDTRFKLAPFLFKRFNDDSTLLTRLERTWIHSDPNGRNSTATSSNGIEDLASIRWERSPAPIGYALDANYSRDPDLLHPELPLTKRTVSGSILFALSPEFVIGPILGRQSSERNGDFRDGPVRGVDLRWRPNEHTHVKGVYQHGVFGKEWDIDASSKTAWTLFRVQSKRAAQTLSAQNATNPQGAIADNFLGAAMNETTSAQLSFLGRRDSINLNGGLTRRQPLEVSSGQRTRTYFFDLALAHKLTPLSTLEGGLAWTRSWALDTAPLPTSPTRDFTARVGLNVKLSPDATASMGFRRQLTHTPDTTSTPPLVRNRAESAATVGLGYSF